MRHTVEWIAGALAVLIIASCTTMEQPGSAPADGRQDVLVTGGEDAAASADRARPGPAPDKPPQEQSSYEPSEPTIYRGTDQVFRRPQSQPPVKLYGESVSLNFEQAPLTEVVHAILGDILELDYIVEHPINGQVTLRTRTPVPRDQLLDILESLLRANQALMVRDKDGRFFVSASGQMNKLNPGVAASAEQALGYSTIIVPLQYISARNMAEILRPVSDENTFVRVDNLRNLLMLAGTRSQLQGFQEIVDTFDVDLLKGMSVGIFPIENTDIEEIDSALSVLLGKGGDGDVEAVSGIGSVVKIIPVHRLNSIMVVTSRAHYLERIETWIERLDREPDANFERRLYVYPVQNTNAGHLASLLSTIFSGDASVGGSGSSTGGGVAPGFTPETVSSGGESAAEGTPSRSGGGGNRSRNFNVGQVKVVADEENNALLIYATGREYAKIKPALERLDIAATQVIIEASIIEVTLTDDLKYGLEWTFDNGLWDDFEGEGQLLNGALGPAPSIPGFAYSFIGGAGDIKAVLNALADESLLNVISSPSVMVLDNQTASIQVGDQVPVSTGSTTTDGGNTVTSIQYRDTGVQLSVTPSVNAGGMVTMDVEQSVTDLGSLEPTGNNTFQRSFLERKIISMVAVRSGESVVLGGLIRENKSEGSSGVPFLHSLPVIGGLFGTKTNESNRTELLVVITPRVIFSDADLREVSREMRRQMRGLDLIDVSESSSFLIDREVDPTPADPGVEGQE